MLISLSDIPTHILHVEQLHYYTASLIHNHLNRAINLQAVNEFGNGYTLSIPLSRKTVFTDITGNDWESREILLPRLSDRDVIKRYQWMHTDRVDSALNVAFPNTYKAANLPN